jgi:hypothetical protein
MCLMRNSGQPLLVSNLSYTSMRKLHSHFIFRSNETKHDLVFLETLMYQSYHGLIHHVGSPPVIGVLSAECFWTAADAVGTPTNPAFIPELMLSYGNHMTFYERLQNTLFWLWMRCVKCEILLIVAYTRPFV